MEVVFHSKLDCMKYIKWPTEFPSKLKEGDLIEFDYKNKLVSLKVSSTRWRLTDGKWVLIIELHLPQIWQSIQDFEQWLES